MVIKLLHLADVHLGADNAYLGDRARERSDEFRTTFRGVIDRALDSREDIAAVLIAGDLFESHRPAPEVFGFAKGLLTRLAAAGIPVILIPGSHDGYGYRDSVWRTERLPGVDILTAASPGAPLAREIRGVPFHFYGIAHVPGVTPSPFPGFTRTDAPGIHVGLLHGRLADSGADGRHTRLEIPPAVLEASGLDYVALGGEHDTRLVPLAGTVAAMSGCLEGRGFLAGEFGKKGFVEVEVAPGSPARATFRPACRRTLVDVAIDLDAEAIRDVQALQCAILSHSGEDRIARITLTGRKEFLVAPADLLGRVAAEFHHIEIVDRSRVVDSALISRIRDESTIRGAFVRRMLAKIEASRARAGVDGGPETERELRTLEHALRLGIEQFVETDAVEPLYAPPASRTPAAPPRLEPAAAAEAPRPAAALPAPADRVRPAAEEDASRRIAMEAEAP